MSLEETYRQANMINIKIIFIFATIFLLIAFFQKLKPTFSLSYLINSKSTHVKAKLISKLITSAVLYIYGFYMLYFADLTQQTLWYSFWALWISIMFYHVFKWGLTKLFDFRNKKNNQ